jgi:hypothetical protein
MIHHPLKGKTDSASAFCNVPGAYPADATGNEDSRSASKLEAI